MNDDAWRPAPWGHVCWSYDDQSAFDARAGAFLASGLASGERVWYVAPESRAQVTERLRALVEFPAALDRGDAQIVTLDSAYPGSRIVDPATQVAAYAAATEAALTAGYTGLRVVADATSLVRTPAQRDAFVRYEHLVDQFMRTRPMSALCAYDRSELGEQAVAELACVHPDTNADGVQFRLYAGFPRDGADRAPADGHGTDRASADSRGAGPAATSTVLSGELDPSAHELFRTALDRADLRPVDGRLVVQATDLRFIDHRALLHLDDYARRRGARAVLRTPRAATARLAELLDLHAVQVEVVG